MEPSEIGEELPADDIREEHVEEAGILDHDNTIMVIIIWSL